VNKIKPQLLDPAWRESLYSDSISPDAFILSAIESGHIHVDVVAGEIWSTTARRGRCIKVTGQLDAAGYRASTFSFKGIVKNIRFHRVVWLSAHRTSIPHGFCVDHINNDRSDNRLSNLRVITNSANLKRRRLRYGEDNPSSNKKLNWAIVEQIRRDYASGMIPSLIASKYEITFWNAWDIVKFRTWATGAQRAR